ncbi:Nucleotide-binding universal stress protein, UspA family [Natronoarchaeum philippinense]|uniref:Nucleotide-binding universal stress protein, UspA family n=1 Tax=Natronoarchaeum philippinense TaxID=558529 RepID=A0A285N0M5_NATPI|nr:universal stress protein [Natronoarchaeum philippinense]SNZ02999.1 Nucleotide-binding universal stress protein, UspA family [Natronoarchaeum philippinense]
MPTRVLVAFDESTQANFALRYALSTYADAEIRVLHVNDPREWHDPGDVGGVTYEVSYERARESAERLLERAAATARDHGREISTDTAEGKAAPTIVRYATEHDFDHIVLGSHGRTGLSRLLLGSVAEHVVRRAHAPVTVVRNEPPELDD